MYVVISQTISIYQNVGKNHTNGRSSVITESHCKQKDGHSCGVHVMKVQYVCT